MKGFIGKAFFIILLMIGSVAAFLLVSRPPGVAVTCDGEVEGFGFSGYPLGTFETRCRAEVEVSQNGETVCTGEGAVWESSAVISCRGLGEMESGEARIDARFYRDGEMYENTTSYTERN